jgi:hypothetical protein
MKKHMLVDGRLLQTNKKYSQLKQSQKTYINENLRKIYLEKKHCGKELPMSIRDEIIRELYVNIEQRGIWIPFNEVKIVACKKIAQWKRKDNLGDQNDEASTDSE